MLTPEQLDEVPDKVEALFRDLEDFMIRDLASRLKEACEVNSTMEWIARRAELIGISNETLYAELERVLGVNKGLLDELFERLAYDSAANDVERFAVAGLNAGRILENDFLRPIVEAALVNTFGEFENIGRSTGMMFNKEFMSFNQYYTKQLDFAHMSVMTGAQTYNEAVRTALQGAVTQGIQYVDYASGYRMNITSASRMITRTGVNQLATQMNDEICDELDLDLVEVTAHGAARPTHKVWQGKIFSRHGNKGEYKDLAEATGLGRVDGLCGANCRHSYYGYLEGSPRAYTQEQLDNIDPPPFVYNGKEYDIYTATQRMRYMERQMRKTQRKICGYEEAGLTEDMTAAQVRLKAQRAEYKEFAKASNIRPRFDKVEYVRGT